MTKSQAAAVDAVDPSRLGPDVAANEIARLQVRRATVHAELAYFAARTGDAALAKESADAARRALMLAERAQLADDDRLAYDEAAMRVATVRWASEAPPAQATAAHGLEIAIAAGEPGQTCVRVKRAADVHPFEHCTYAVVWPSSVRIAPHESAVTMVTQPLVGWSELLVLRSAQGTWSAETLAPAAIDPDLGYVELAGFTPDGAHLLVARESRASGPLGSPNTLAPWAQKAFQLVATSDLHVEKQAHLAGELRFVSPVGESGVDRGHAGVAVRVGLRRRRQCNRTCRQRYGASSPATGEEAPCSPCSSSPRGRP